MGLFTLPLSLLLAAAPGTAASGTSMPLESSAVPMPQDAFETVLMEGDIPQLHLACEQSASVGANERLQLLRDRLMLIAQHRRALMW